LNGIREEDEGLISGAAIVAGSFLPLSYIILAIVGAIGDREGVPLSPLIAAALTVPLMATLERLEELGNEREPTWGQRHPFWFTFVGIAIYVFAAIPLMAGLLWPFAVLEPLPSFIAFSLHLLPLLWLILSMVVSRYLFLRSGGDPTACLKPPSR
jgi:hypothetical protein